MKREDIYQDGFQMGIRKTIGFIMLIGLLIAMAIDYSGYELMIEINFREK